MFILILPLIFAIASSSPALNKNALDIAKGSQYLIPIVAASKSEIKKFLAPDFRITCDDKGFTGEEAIDVLKSVVDRVNVVNAVENGVVIKNEGFEKSVTLAFSEDGAILTDAQCVE